MTEFYQKRRMYGRGNEEVQQGSRTTHSKGQGKDLAQKHLNLTLKMLKPTFGDVDHAKKLLENGQRKASQKPVKMLVAEETSKEAECGHYSPSIVAKLMGLDALPGPQVTSKHKRKAVENLYPKKAFEKQKKQSESLLNAYQWCPTNDSLPDIHSAQRHVMEHQEFKDVFEIQEMPRAHKLSYSRYQSSVVSSKQSDRDSDVAFVRQKFMDAKRLSTDEKLRNSKEFHDVLDDLHSNKDLFLRVLQEPDSLLTKHTANLQPVPIHSATSHITVLKSSKTRVEVELSDNYGSGDIYWKRMSEGRINMQKGSGSFLRDYNVARVSSGRTSICPSDRPCQFQDYKSNNYLKPTRIVVLKPRSIPQPGLLPSQNSLTNQRMQRVRQPSSRGMFEEVMNWQKLSKNNAKMSEGSVRLRSKGSREISREVTKELRQSVGRSSFNMSHMPSFNNEDQSYSLLTSDLIDDSQVFSPSGVLCEWSNKLNSCPYPMDIPAGKEAKKHLSERWRISPSSGEVAHLGRSSSTLGDMLGMHELNTDKEKPFTLGYVIGQGRCRSNSAEKEASTSWGSKAARSSRAFKQVGFAADATRLRSRAVSAEGCELRKAANRFGSVDGIVNDLIAREVITPGPEWTFSGRHFNVEEKTFTGDWKSDDYRSHSYCLAKPDNYRMSSGNDCLMHGCMKLDGLRSLDEERLWYDKCLVNLTDVTAEKQLQESLSVAECYSEVVSQHDDDIPSQELEPSFQAINFKDSCACVSPDPDNNIAEILSSEHGLATSLHCLPQTGVDHVKDDTVNKDSPEQPSPVSILEPPFDEEFSSSDCFDKISAGLDGLRKQLCLLRMESVPKYAEDMDFESSADEDYADGCHNGLDQAERVGDESIEFTFLRDVLTTSGFCGDQNSLNTWHSPDCPLNPCLFEQLDKKYSKQEQCCPGNTKDRVVQRSERRLLFDRINAGLKEKFWPTVKPHSCVQARARSVMAQQWEVQQLAEKLWEQIQSNETESVEQMEVMLRKNLERDVEWRQLSDDVDLVGAEIEHALVRDLIVEMVSELYT